MQWVKSGAWAAGHLRLGRTKISEQMAKDDLTKEGRLPTVFLHIDDDQCGRLRTERIVMWPTVWRSLNPRLHHGEYCLGSTGLREDLDGGFCSGTEESFKGADFSALLVCKEEKQLKIFRRNGVDAVAGPGGLGGSSLI